MMDVKEDTERDGGAPNLPVAAYEPPRIEQTAEFETLALSCGKATGYFGCYGSYTDS